VIIDGDEASIVTEFSGPSGVETDKRKCVTYLVRKDDVWKVDYKSTGENLHGGPLGILFGKLNQLGGELSRDLDASIKDLNVEMERLSRKLKDMTDSVAQQATKIIDRHAQELQNIMNELAESIKRALQDKHNHPSDKDRQTLREVAADLDASSQHLSSPTTASVTESNQQMGSVQQRLERIDNGITDDYKQRWQALSKQFADVMKKMVDELAMSEKSKNNPQ
jgi:archaellum component FlaC